MKQARSPSHSPLQFLQAMDGLGVRQAAHGLLSDGASAAFIVSPRFWDLCDEGRPDMCSRMCLPSHLSRRIPEPAQETERKRKCSLCHQNQSALQPGGNLKTEHEDAATSPESADGEALLPFYPLAHPLKEYRLQVPMPLRELQSTRFPLSQLPVEGPPCSVPKTNSPRTAQGFELVPCL